MTKQIIIIVIASILAFILYIILFGQKNHKHHHNHMPPPAPPPPKPNDGYIPCYKTINGCCNNKITPKGDYLGYNCVHPNIHVI